MSNSGTTAMWKVAFVGWIIYHLSTAAVAHETCEDEVFVTNCSHLEVAVITSASYGRMRLGRCVQKDFGHVGCSADATHYMRTQCSGRQYCEVYVPDNGLDELNPCPLELKASLEVIYSCIPVLRPADRSERCTSPQIITTKAGYISSEVARETSCGRLGSGWDIVAGPGQTINFTIHDFSSWSQSTAPTYIVFSELQDNVKTFIYLPRSHIQGNIYSSYENRVHVEMFLGDVESNFVIHFGVTGCSDIEVTGMNFMRLAYDHSTAELTCWSDRSAWILFCNGTDWQGLDGIEQCHIQPTEKPRATDSASLLFSSLLPFVTISWILVF